MMPGHSTETLLVPTLTMATKSTPEACYLGTQWFETQYFSSMAKMARLHCPSFLILSFFRLLFLFYPLSTLHLRLKDKPFCRAGV